MAVDASCRCTKYTPFDLKRLLPWPAQDAHKYSRGKLVVVAGSARFPGAATLAALAGQRMGAGYVEVLCAPESVVAVQSARPSLVVGSWDRVVSGRMADFPASSTAKPVACVVGPGFEADDAECRRIARCVLEGVDAPIVVDGGALAALTGEQGRGILGERARRGLVTVATPHGGEAARLARAVGLSLDHMVSGEAARCLAQSYGVVCALKGSDTFVSDGAQVVAVREGTAALAKAGTGDVLAGMMGALLAQGLGAVDAAVLAATLHARSGVAAADCYTDIGVTAEDVIDCLPIAIRSL